MPSYEFNLLVSNKRNRDYICKELSRRAQSVGLFYNELDLDICLQYCDRELFANFRDRKLTLAQFKCRVM